MAENFDVSAAARCIKSKILHSTQREDRYLLEISKQREVNSGTNSF